MSVIRAGIFVTLALVQVGLSTAYPFITRRPASFQCRFHAAKQFTVTEKPALLMERDVLPKYVVSYRQTLWTLEKLREQIALFIHHGDLIYWLEAPQSLFKPDWDDSDETLLRAIPKRLGEMLHADLWGKGVPIVLTSGTLSASGDFSHVKNSLGLNLLPPSVVMETSKPSPYDYNENAMIYISESVPFPDNDNPEYIAAVADETERHRRCGDSGLPHSRGRAVPHEGAESPAVLPRHIAHAVVREFFIAKKPRAYHE